MTDQAVRMLARWDEAVAAAPDKPVDVSAEMVRLTMAVVAEVMFGAAVEDQVDAISAAIQVGQEDIQFRITNRQALTADGVRCMGEFAFKGKNFHDHRLSLQPLTDTVNQ